MVKTNSDESLLVLLRLWLDEMVEDLSRNETGSRSVARATPDEPINDGCAIQEKPEWR